jgi:PEP-CTERM motif
MWILGVNFKLNGVDGTTDFFPAGVVKDGSVEERVASTPEPTGLALFALGTAGVAGVGCWRRQEGCVALA